MMFAVSILLFATFSIVFKRSSAMIGFIRYLSTPTSIAFNKVSFSLCALRTMTGVSLEISLIYLVISSPSLIGINTSVITIFGLYFLNFFKPSSPF